MQIDLSKLEWVYKSEILTIDGRIDGVLFAHITKRPGYCDRGHWQANVDLPLGLDHQDGFPRYYMQLETAKEETELFLDWRINKVRNGYKKSNFLKE